MDTRRVLIPAAAVWLVAGCASLGDRFEPAVDGPPATSVDVGPVAPTPVQAMPVALPATARPYMDLTEDVPGPAVDGASKATAALTGRAANAAANGEARAASRSDRFVGGVQVFAWAPGRIYEVWTAPLRVTTLTLAPGETVISKAAGDTVRWQIGDTTSGEGAQARTHVLLKPLERGLETNLVLTTSRRVYWLELKSGSADGFNAAVAWETPEPEPLPTAEAVEPAGLVMPEGALDARFRIRSRGRAPGWMPTAVFTDGTRTFITLPPGAWADEAPVLLVLASDGEAQLVNYRQQGGLLVVDRVFDRAELRSSDRRARIVHLERLAGDRS